MQITAIGVLLIFKASAPDRPWLINISDPPDERHYNEYYNSRGDRADEKDPEENLVNDDR